MKGNFKGMHDRYEWCDGENEVPIHENLVLAVASGTNGVVTIVNAIKLAYYVEGKGWISEKWPDMKITVKWWMEIPEVPK